MVTSNKGPDEKIVKMAEQNNSVVVPQRTLIGEVNEHITCTLCRGYYIDATTIVECLHSFCRSCIIKHLQVKSYCPVCEMMINSAKPNIKLDKALQDIVYKLVPGLFQKEMERRQQFYASRPGPAASATPEQRGEDTERIIFSPEDVISFSLEYADLTDADSISSKSSDSNEAQNTLASARRYLQCPAVVNINHLKKFLSMKFEIDSTQFAIDILYKRVPLPDYYTLMDIAYIYNWKRNEPMRFFYQIIDYVAMRNRFFDINRKSSLFPGRKPSPTSTEETNTSSPLPNINENASEASSGTDSPMPDDIKKTSDELNKIIVTNHIKDVENKESSSCASSLKKNDDEVEKSQFLNSFELTARNNTLNAKTSPPKANTTEALSSIDTSVKNNLPKIDDSLKRKQPLSSHVPEMKKLKIELEKAKIPGTATTTSTVHLAKDTPKLEKPYENSEKLKDNAEAVKSPQTSTFLNSPSQKQTISPKEIKQQQSAVVKPQISENIGMKRNNSASQNTSSPKRKPNESPTPQSSSTPKTVSPLKLQIPKLETSSSASKLPEVSKPTIKKMPDLKPSATMSSTSLQNKGPSVNKVRMDLLANNSDPTIDRSKILSQVKSSLSLPNPTQTSGDPLKSLFDSCKINIPSSLSITLTDQKLETRSVSESLVADQKKIMVNKNLSSASNMSAHKVPSPPVHNYIEILKLPETDPKKGSKNEGNNDIKVSSSKSDSNTISAKLPNKSSETSAKGPIPNLKPIADTKLGKQSGSFAAPITFQQTFEQQLQSMQSDKKSKLSKNKAQVPKLVPATPKAFNAVNKIGNPNIKSAPSTMPPLENKGSAALDLSTPHNIQSQLGPQQTKAFETMQSIANLAKKQGLSSKSLPVASSQANVFTSMSNRPTNTGNSPLRVPSTSGINQMKLDKINSGGTIPGTLRQEVPNNKLNQMKQVGNSNSMIPNLGYPITAHSFQNTAQPSPRSQTRSPSSSPKLVIAEEKQSNNNSLEHNINQSNQITSTQLSNMNASKSESPKPSPGPSKTMKPLIPAGKVPGIRQPLTPTMKPSPVMNTSADYLTQAPLLSTHPGITQLLRHQMEMQTAWLKAHRQYDLYNKNISSMGHQSQNDFNSKDKHDNQDKYQMSAVQASIPFKHRKKTNIRSKENQTKENSSKSNVNLKRSKKMDDDMIIINEYECSPTKILKVTNTSDDDVDKENSSDGYVNSNNLIKPLVCREKEIAWLENVLMDHLDNKESVSLYISGQPGTGKTASLRYILHLSKIKNGYKQVYVNCTMMKSATSIYSRICKELQLRPMGTTEKACLSAVEKYLKKNDKMILLVLDEVDQLDSKRQSVLYTIFEWPALFSSHLVLVGIANALDLTERTLPRLQTRCSLRPLTLHFAPYTKQQIIDIFVNVLAGEDQSRIFSPVALQMLAAKIAAVSGDMRRALDIGKRVIELARRSKFVENRSVETLMMDANVTVEVKQVLEVLNDIYGGCRKIENDVEDGLPMQQKLILCSVMLMLTKGKNKELNMGKLHDVYKRVASARNIAPLDMSEMSSACSLLETRGALRVCGPGGRSRRLRLHWDEAELIEALRDKPLLSAILNDVSCLSSN
ncbi:polycomb group protein Psc-like [Battus philenor]|uniref:polycomb group protein Psc-like n=1 Tax=Battus philenor TaxID=42288 RepID=UPI0035D01BA2